MLWPYCPCNKTFTVMGNGPGDSVKSSSLKRNWRGNCFKKERRQRCGKRIDGKWSEGFETEGVMLEVVLGLVLKVLLGVVILGLLWALGQEPAAQAAPDPRQHGWTLLERT